MGPSAHLPGLRARRLLRQLAGRHAGGHARDAGHPLIRSLEPGEDWSRCFQDQVAKRIREITGKTRIPPSPLGG